MSLVRESGVRIVSQHWQVLLCFQFVYAVQGLHLLSPFEGEILTTTTCWNRELFFLVPLFWPR